MSHLIIVGPPGCGKGTISKKLAKDFNFKHVSTGDLLRNTGDKNVQEILKNGNFVSDECITQLIEEELLNNSCILDGFPRTLVQAEYLEKCKDKNINISLVLLINTSERECIRRIQNREDQREDDRDVEVIRRRLKVYHMCTEPLIEFYKERNLLVTVNGNKTKDEVYNDILEILKRKGI